MENIITGGVENKGMELTVGDNASIGMPDQVDCPYEAFSTGDKMKRGKQSNIFDNNGSSNKGSSGGVINNNGEYGQVTYGF
jgi:hypothetical protein